MKHLHVFENQSFESSIFKFKHIKKKFAHLKKIAAKNLSIFQTFKSLCGP